MSTSAQRKMTVDEFLVWAEGQDGRWELYNGVPYAMAPERARPWRGQVRRSDSACAGHPQGGPHLSHAARRRDGARLAVCRARARCPGVLRAEAARKLHRGARAGHRGGGRLALDAKIDASLKLTGYFSLPSVQHYLIVDPDGPPVIHHRRQATGRSDTIVHDGVLTLAPPGIEVGVAEIFAAA